MKSIMEFEIRILKIYVSRTIRDHPYIKLAKGLGGWRRKMAIFADVQYYIYAAIVGQKKSKTMQT